MAARTGILVVDDDGAIGDLMAELLADEGYQTFLCATTAEADRLLARTAPALLILDERLGGERGTDWLARRVRAGDALPPAVLMSASPLAPHEVVNLVVVDILVKPFNIEELIMCVARHYPRYMGA
jgi:DNA-binding response OmpR family regulator